MGHVGEDRGARIEITDSTFKHSHFCKGMISYRQTDKIAFVEEPRYLKYSNQLNRTEPEPDGRNSSFIRIQNSHFENLGYFDKIEVLSNLGTKTTTGSTELWYLNKVFDGYDNRGFVLNTKAFPGGIQIQNSTFAKNMAFIKDYLVVENKLG